MPLQFSTGVFNQKRWPKAGDVDDCWCLADLMAVHGVAPWLRLPNITEFRAAAEKPDVQGVPNGGTVDDSFKAIRKLWPDLQVELVAGGTFATVLAAIKGGRPVSLSVLSGSLPAALQFGFTGAHRVCVYWNATDLKVLNPLARPHSRSKVIEEAVLEKAANDHPPRHVDAVLMPTSEAAFRTHPLLQGAIDAATHPVP
jgi:hypothetical protein